jgi:hypothetical protein
MLRFVRLACRWQSLVKPLLNTPNAVRFIKIATINLDCGVYIPMPKNFRKREVILGMILQPFDRENVAQQVGIYAPSCVSKDDWGFRGKAGAIPKLIRSAFRN